MSEHTSAGETPPTRDADDTETTNSVPQPHPQGGLILALGIIGLTCCLPAAVFAWLLGNGVQKEIDANPGAYSNATSVQTGRFLGAVGTILHAIVFLLFLFSAARGGFARYS